MFKAIISRDKKLISWNIYNLNIIFVEKQTYREVLQNSPFSTVATMETKKITIVVKWSITNGEIATFAHPIAFITNDNRVCRNKQSKMYAIGDISMATVAIFNVDTLLKIAIQTRWRHCRHLRHFSQWRLSL